LTYDAFTTSTTNREQESDLRLLERVLEKRMSPKQTPVVEPPGNAWRQELRFRGRESDRRTRNDFEKCPWVRELKAPDVGSFHMDDDPGVLTFIEWLELQKAVDREDFADELALYATGDGAFGHWPQDEDDRERIAEIMCSMPGGTADVVWLEERPAAYVVDGQLEFGTADGIVIDDPVTDLGVDALDGLIPQRDGYVVCGEHIA
jgi:hypothetical protein